MRPTEGSTESHSRQEHRAKITVVQVLVEVTTKNDNNIESAQKNLESTHREKQDGDEQQLFCSSCIVYYKWQLNSSHTHVTILVDSSESLHISFRPVLGLLLEGLLHLRLGGGGGEVAVRRRIITWVASSRKFTEFYSKVVDFPS